MSSSDVRVPFNDLTRQARNTWARCTAQWAETVSSGRVILGAAVAKFEADFALYLGGGQVVGVGNGTDALELALRAVGVSTGSFVITAANAGFYATTAIFAAKATPVYVDVAESSVTPDAASIDAALSSGGADAVVITHLFGRLADDIEAIADVCQAHNVPLVEDCSQSHGARLGDVLSGAFGDAAAFSFYPTKNLGALGDAGALFTRSASVGSKARALRQYGWGVKYVVDELGGRNSRLDEVQAIVLSESLPALDVRNETRRRIVETYQAAAPHLDFLSPVPDREQWVGHLCVIRVDDRSSVQDFLAERGIATEVHFPVPDHRQPAMRQFALPGLPRTEHLAKTVLSLPCFPDMTPAEIDRVADVIATLPL